MPILECRGVQFLSDGDEKAFFGLLRANKAIRRIEGVGHTLRLHVLPRVSDRALRELLATFRRYHVAMDQLAQFSSERNRAWFEDPKSYWFDEVFDSKPHRRTSNPAMERAAGVKGRGGNHPPRVSRGRSSPGRLDGRSHVVKARLDAVKALSDDHRDPGQRLFDACKGELFPCDALAFAVLERSLNLLHGFHLLLSNGGYTPGVALLRMQLDNLLRFNGIVKSGDPHEVANAIINGTALREMRDGSGMKMTDTRLVKVFATNNPWVRDVYELACGYVHLSDHHIRHFLARSKQNAAGLRDFAIGDEDEHVSGEHKVQLIDAFAVLTRGVLGMVRQWSAVRDAYGSNEQLRSKFNAPI